MAELEEDPATQLLRIIAQSNLTDGQELPSSKPPSSIIYVNALWFLSIALSLGASTWAMLCQEWCALHLQGRKPEDYTEMATKRQRSFQAIKKWRMEALVISIPFILHLSLFLFLVGLWLRLAEKNQILGLFVGVPASIITATYIVFTLLPVFTDAPFYTSASELVELALKHFRRPPQLPRILWPPVFTSLTGALSSAFPSKNQPDPNAAVPPDTPSFLRKEYWNAKRTLKRFTYLAISALKQIYKRSAPPVFPLWRGILAFLPRFEFAEDGPLEELNWLTIDPPEQNSDWRARALFWLLQMPLNQREVGEVLQELDKITRMGDSHIVDRQFVGLLVLCLSSVLADGYISTEEKPVTIHCMRVLARALDHAFFISESKELIILKNDAVSAALDPLFARQAPQSVNNRLEWEDMVASLWFCPTRERIELVVDRVDRGVHGLDKDLLMSTVHGLHAAMLNWFRSQRSVKLPIPDILAWDRMDTSEDLDGEVLAYLHDLFGALCESFGSPKKTALLPALMIESLRLLDENEDLPTTLLNALCSFIIVGWRVNPGSLDTDPSIADAMLRSVERQSHSTPITEDTLTRLAYKLDAIAYGPGVRIGRDYLPLTKLESVFYRVIQGWGGGAEGLTRFVKRFLDAYTSTMENIFSLDGYAWNVYRYSDTDVMSSMNVLSDPNIFILAQANPEYRLPFLYSLTIALSYENEARPIAETVSRVGELFITTDGDNDHIDKAMDTNFFAAAVLGQVMGHQRLRDPEAGVLLDWLQRNLFPRANQIRWKGIYLLAELTNIIDDIRSRPACILIKQSLLRFRNDRKALGKPFADPDWDRKRGELRLCGLEPVMKSIPGSLLLDHGVYGWKDGIPLLFLYPQYSSQDPEDQALYKFLTNLQRFAFFCWCSVRYFVDDAPRFSELPLRTLLIKQVAHLPEAPCRKRGRGSHTP